MFSSLLLVTVFYLLLVTEFYLLLSSRLLVTVVVIWQCECPPPNNRYTGSLGVQHPPVGERTSVVPEKNACQGAKSHSKPSFSSERIVIKRKQKFVMQLNSLRWRSSLLVKRNRSPLCRTSGWREHRFDLEYRLKAHVFLRLAHVLLFSRDLQMTGRGSTRFNFLTKEFVLLQDAGIGSFYKYLLIAHPLPGGPLAHFL